MKCDECSKEARWRVSATSTRLQHNRYGCDDHKDSLKKEVKETIADGERALGNPFYPQVSKSGFGEVTVSPL